MTAGRTSPDVADALADRALGRATLASALLGVALGVLATAFLVLSGSRTDATTLPVVVLLVAGQLAALVAAAGCGARLRGARRAPGSGPGQAAAAARMLDQALPVLVAVGAAVVVGAPVLLQPRATALLSAVVGAVVLAQAGVALALLRRPLRTAARPASAHER